MEEENTHTSRKLNGDGLLHRQSLPDDLIIEILLRHPVRSLLQFKHVCKSWKTLISDSQFAKRHLHRLTMDPSIINLQIIFASEFGFGRIVSLPLKPLLEKPSEPIKAVEIGMEQYRFSILGECNGLVCLLDITQGYVTLWNPSTRFKSKKSPSIGKWRVANYGFGYDHVNDKYKVLLDVRPHGNRNNHNVRLYTFGENSWTTIQNFPCPPTGFTIIGKFVSGTLNWVVSRVGDYEQTTILSFDIVKETYSEILLPQNQKHDGRRDSEPKLGVLDNCLCLCFDINTHLVLWLMKEYGVVESWTKLMMIPAEHLRKHVEWPIIFVIEPLFIFGNNIVLLRTNYKFLLYNLNNGKIDIPLISTSIRRSPHLYLETLISPPL
ncbi:F-box/kelch-repeat protein At3g23880-like [Vicia villosa]|uniref:F-box/kelch-repeat protein At3g23880-like n=1 Tax=Vicia villosa TaxID=3911 RepID=UPI00273C26C6|nr:F-box/kelch-repeat protein At3g23880-like [Vicia villosa]